MPLRQARKVSPGAVTNSTTGNQILDRLRLRSAVSIDVGRGGRPLVGYDLSTRRVRSSGGGEAFLLA